ncbi:helix-turn-helix transcriptional regulator [Candidatus Nitrososphaera sp. FF02]|uniref:helix-turn-helix transcriptional regulator n=1 Tax=Candidatus Nitrososphaera sp. FF02 TaxID=3398226 RepID=UPI0039ECE88A
MDGSGELEAADLFMELANETRCAMMTSVAKRPAKLSTLARELGITVQDVHRNANRLVEAGLFERRDGELGLSEFGRVVAMQMPYFAFMKKNRKFFEEHTLTTVPDKFVQRVGALAGCRVVENVTVVMEDLKRLETSAKKQLKIMVTQAWPEEGQILVDRAKSGVEVQVMIGRNTVFPKNVVDGVASAIDKMRPRIVDTKMVDRLGMAVYIADDRAAVMLPNTKGEVDMRTMLAGEDRAFVEWCLDLFDHTWARAGPADIKKAKIV